MNTVKPRLNDSPIWKDLLKVRHIYLGGRNIKPGNGTKTLFWTDVWLGEIPLCSKLSTLFELCVEKTITLNTFLAKMAGSTSEDGYLMSYRNNGKRTVG